MNVTTENLTFQVKETLLGLPDVLLMDTVLGWIERADVMHEYLGCDDYLRYLFGYRLQSGDTEEIYDSFDSLDRSESESALALWVPPTIDELRYLLSDFSLLNFHDFVLPLADDAISAINPQLAPYWPSTALEEGRPFMRYLIPYLQKKAHQKPENGHLLLPRRIARARNSPETSYKDSPVFDLWVEMIELSEPGDD